MRKNHIYLIGVGILGLAYSFLKHSFEPVIFFAICITYLFVLSFIAKKYGKKTD